MATLVETYGLDAGLPAIASALEEGCPRKGEHGGCFVVWEELGWRVHSRPAVNAPFRRPAA